MMEDLRAFLESKPASERTLDGDFAWQCVKRKLLELRHNCIATDVSTVAPASRLSIEEMIDKSKVADGDRVILVCVEGLKRCVCNCTYPYVILPSDVIALVDLIISALVNLFQKQSFRGTFLQEFIKIKGRFPIQLLWRLQRAGILQISTYACQFDKFHKNDGGCSHLPDSVLWLLTHSSQSPDYLQMARDVLASLLVTSQGAMSSVQHDLSISSVSLLQKFTEQIVKWVLSAAPPLLKESSGTSFHLTYLSSLELYETCGEDAVKWFALIHLMQLLSEDATCNSISTICEAVQNQEKNWTIESSPSCLMDLLFMIVSTLGIDEVVRHMGGAVVKTSANWKVILLMTSMLVKTFPSSSGDHFKGLTEELLRIGLEGGRQIELSAAFLLARQCCYSRCEHFLSYSSWFSAHFGLDSATARSPVQYQSLLQLLTELAPVEAADTLRVHLNKVPQAPTNCQSLLHDYTVLARTRLADLNESTELVGLFGNSRQEPLNGVELRLSDLSKVLEHFQRTGEIMKPVFEAAIFRPQYYRDIFLPDLLGLSETNCKFNEDMELDNIRNDFVSVLKSMNKIPEKLLREYQQRKHPVPTKSSERVPLDIKTWPVVDKVEAKPEVKKKKSLQVKLKK